MQKRRAFPGGRSPETATPVRAKTIKEGTSPTRQCIPKYCRAIPPEGQSLTSVHPSLVNQLSSYLAWGRIDTLFANLDVCTDLIKSACIPGEFLLP